MLSREVNASNFRKIDVLLCISVPMKRTKEISM